MHMNKNEYVKNNKLKIKELEFIQELVKLRYTNNLSQRQLADETGIKQPIIANLETGKHSPMLSTVFKILDIYGYDITIKKRH